MRALARRLLAIAAVAVMIGAPSLATADAKPCRTTKFRSELVRDACAKGGQKAAQEAMKRFMKPIRFGRCTDCHSKLVPSYDLKPVALDKFKAAGGKLLDVTPGPKTPAPPPKAN